MKCSIRCLRFLIQGSERYPSDLHLPQFTYNEDLQREREPSLSDPYQELPTYSPFDFSALFQPSDDGSPPALSILRTTPRSILRQDAESFLSASRGVP